MPGLATICVLFSHKANGEKAHKYRLCRHLPSYIGLGLKIVSRFIKIVNRYHIGTNYSCAESILLGCEEYYHLHLPEQARKLFTLLGSGMQTGLSCCGALTAGTAILGLMTTPDGAWNSDNPVGAALVDELTNVFGQFETLWCDELRGLEIDGYEDPCYCVVETVAKKLQELIARCEEEIPHAE